jgi:cardiolipin synthase A/B
VRLSDARGPLSVAQSQSILARLRDSTQSSSLFDRHLAVEQELAGTSLTAGNQVRLLQDGPATYSAMLAAIAQAKDHINMETYILEDDEIGRKFAQALVNKQRQGVQVQLLHDSLGTVNTPALFFQRLTDAGVRVVEFNPINPLLATKGWQLNQRDHRKLLIVDGMVAFLGGINISGVYSASGFGRSSRQQADPIARWRKKTGFQR